MPDLRQACEDYLSAKNCTLWSDFDISRPERRHAAAVWLEAQIRGVADIYDGGPPIQHGPDAYNAQRVQELNDGLDRLAGSLPEPAWTEAARQHLALQAERSRPSALVTHGQQPEAW